MSFPEEISLLFSDHQHRLGEVIIDAVIKETHELRAQATEHPTEEGESFCDHVQLSLPSLQIEGIITNTPMTFLGVTAVKSLVNFSQGQSNDHAEQAFKKLEDIFAQRKPISIATSLKEYPNMVLESLTIERGGGTSHSLHFRATAKQIRMISQATIKLPEPKHERAKPQQKMGKQESKPASEEIKKKVADKQSLLSAIFSGSK